MLWWVGNCSLILICVKSYWFFHSDYFNSTGYPPHHRRCQQFSTVSTPTQNDGGRSTGVVLIVVVVVVVSQQAGADHTLRAGQSRGYSTVCGHRSPPGAGWVSCPDHDQSLRDASGVSGPVCGFDLGAVQCGCRTAPGTGWHGTPGHGGGRFVRTRRLAP